MGLWAWLTNTPDHECRFSSGEDYPEHCTICGVVCYNSPSYRRAIRRHLKENREAVQRGANPQWSIDRRAL